MSPRQIPQAVGLQAIALYRADGPGMLADAEQVANACRYSLQELAKRAPGRAVEIRVPPFGAVQAIAGPTHTRGTPPAVVEMTPQVWLDLATGVISWQEAVDRGDVVHSGHRANLQEWLPLPGLG